jgi:hypothetical protein
MPRPRILKSVEWRAPDGQRLYPLASWFLPPSPFAPVLSPQWDDAGEIETTEQYEDRVVAFLKRREQSFARSLDTKRKRTVRARRPLEQIECELERERERDRRRKRAQTDEQREARRVRERSKLKPFMGVDGEGFGTDDKGRQNYGLMNASDALGREHVLDRDGRALSVRDCLDFILSLPASHILVGYYFRYDVNQILRGMLSQEKTLRKILKPYRGKNGSVCSTHWGDYAITYQEGQFFSVGKLEPFDPANKSRWRKIIKGSTRIVYEPFGFFQCSFVKALDKFGIGTAEERERIKINKDRRGDFTELTTEIIEYCKLECRLLAQLMDKFRKTCHEAGIFPDRWSGAGRLAAALLKQNGIPKRPLTTRESEAGKGASSEPRRPNRDPELEKAATAAYVAGRFETSRLGRFDVSVWQYDLRSAYPAAMRSLPCPFHTEWEHRPGARRLPRGGVYLAKVTFIHPDTTLWCGLPFRRKHRLTWPLAGTGWYWSPEIEKVRKHLGAKITVHDLWVAHTDGCDCELYKFIDAIYAKRIELGSKTEGEPLKLGINSLYGKTAQRRTGTGPYYDVVAAGLTTSMTRARLIEAYSHAPDDVVMIATDAVYSLRPLPLDIGEGLGQWEKRVWSDFFIVKPGVYWSPSERDASLKSRGAPRSIVGRAVPQFEAAFAEWLDLLRQPGGIEWLHKERLIPSATLTLQIFNSIRRSLARGRPWLAGKWETFAQNQSFEWALKRDPDRIEVADGHIKTFPQENSPLAESESPEPADFDTDPNIYREEHAEDLHAEAIDDVIDALPDFVEWSEWE